jgi:hypothetical protein
VLGTQNVQELQSQDYCSCSSRAEKTIVNKVENQISTVAETNQIVDGLIRYCVNLRYGKWVEQFVVLQSFSTSSNLNLWPLR